MKMFKRISSLWASDDTHKLDNYDLYNFDGDFTDDDVFVSPDELTDFMRDIMYPSNNE